MVITDMQIDKLWRDPMARQMFENETRTEPLPRACDRNISTRWLAFALEAYHIKFINWAKEKFRDRNFPSGDGQDVINNGG